jgi:hypothetical protein
MMDALKALDSILDRISELPKQKSAEFTKKMSLLLYLSLLPLANLGATFAIIAMIQKYLPALNSYNSAYIELRRAHIGKYHTYFYVCMGLVLIGVIASFLCGAAARPFLLTTAGTYIPSLGALYAKARQFTGLAPLETQQ